MKLGVAEAGAVRADHRRPGRVPSQRLRHRLQDLRQRRSGSGGQQGRAFDRGDQLERGQLPVGVGQPAPQQLRQPVQVHLGPLRIEVGDAVLQV